MQESILERCNLQSVLSCHITTHRTIEDKAWFRSWINSVTANAALELRLMPVLHSVLYALMYIISRALTFAIDTATTLMTLYCKRHRKWQGSYETRQQVENGKTCDIVWQNDLMRNENHQGYVQFTCGTERSPSHANIQIVMVLQQVMILMILKWF